MVLTYLSRPISYNRLLKTLGVQPNVGAPFSNLRLLERLKITVIYEQGTMAQLHRFLTFGWPCIVPVKSGQLPYWKNIDTDHALVIVGMDAISVYLNDPAFAAAPFQVPLGDLSWRGSSVVRITLRWHRNISTNQVRRSNSNNSRAIFIILTSCRAALIMVYCLCYADGGDCA
jgi:hypothetical protein